MTKEREDQGKTSTLLLNGEDRPFIQVVCT